MEISARQLQPLVRRAATKCVERPLRGLSLGMTSKVTGDMRASQADLLSLRRSKSLAVKDTRSRYPVHPGPCTDHRERRLKGRNAHQATGKGVRRLQSESQSSE